MKTESSTIAGQYAEAVIEIAFKEGEKIADAVMSDLTLVATTFKANPDLGLVLGHPSIKTEEKRELVKTLFAKSIQELTLRLLELLLDKRRIAIVPAVETEYHKLLNGRKNIVSASLICAEKLSDSAIANIKARLAEHVGSHLELSIKEDKSLLGGVVLRLGDQVIDGSLKGKLANLERVLLSV
jgi:F-type H+-transporting ATPase subunit delta